MQNLNEKPSQKTQPSQYSDNHTQPEEVFANYQYSDSDDYMTIKKIQLKSFIERAATQKIQCHQAIDRLIKENQRKTKLLEEYQQLKITQTSTPFTQNQNKYNKPVNKDTLRIQQLESTLEKERFLSQKIKEELDLLQEKLKYEIGQNKRKTEFLKIKDEIIKNLNWQKSIIFQEQQDLKKKNESFLKEQQQSESQSKRKGKLDEIDAIKCQSFYEESLDVSHIKSTEKILRRENFQLRNELSRLRSNHQKITSQMQILQIQKEHTDNQYKLLSQHSSTATKSISCKEQKKQNKDVGLLAKKCLDLESHIEKLTKKLMGGDVDRRQIVQNPFERMDSLNSPTNQPITPHFPKDLSKIFGRKSKQSVEKQLQRKKMQSSMENSCQKSQN